MSEIKLEKTAKTPEVKFSTGPVAMSLAGRSIPENSIEFYKPLLDWVDSNVEDNDEAVNISIRLEYFNTCLLYTSPSPRDRQKSRMPSSA